MKTPALKDAPDSAPSGAFISTLTALKNGQFITEIDDALREVTEAVSKVQARGTLTISFTIAPGGVGLGECPLFKITPDVAAKCPQIAEKPQVFFADEHFNLTRRNPNQTEDARLTVVEGTRPQGVAAARSAVNS